MLLSRGDSTQSKTKYITNKNFKQKNNCKKCYEGKKQMAEKDNGWERGQGKVSTLNRLSKDIPIET